MAITKDFGQPYSIPGAGYMTPAYVPENLQTAFWNHTGKLETEARFWELIGLLQKLEVI